MHLVVDFVASCKLEVTDTGSEEVVLMKIFQILVCVKNKASVMLSNRHIYIIVDSCLHIIHQSGTKSELWWHMACYTMHEFVRCIFSHLQDVDNTDNAVVNGNTTLKGIGFTLQTSILVAMFSFSYDFCASYQE